MSALLRLLNHFRPREGWPALLLTLAAVLCPAAAFLEAREDPGWGWLLSAPILAFCAALALARARASARTAATLGVLLGSLLAVVASGQLVPPLTLLWSELRYASRWIEQWQMGTIGHPLPLSAAGGFVWQRLAELGARLWWWGGSAVAGGAALDPIILSLLAAALAWGLAFVATWQVYRRRAALPGFLPGGAVLATLAFFRGGLSTFYLASYLSCAICLTAACSLWARRERWHRAGIDYPGDLGLELVLALAPALTLLLAAGMLLPVIRPRQISEAFWDLMAEPWSVVEQTSSRLFGPIIQSEPVPVGRSGTMPRSHLLGSAAELADEVVFTVSTNDEPPPQPGESGAGLDGPEPQRRYWRTMTYDTYTGQGWINGPLQRRTITHDEPFDASGLEGPSYASSGKSAFELWQQFDLAGMEETLLLSVNAPSQVNHTVESWWRALGDLAHATGSARSYRVISHPPAPTLEELRTAPETLPVAIAERYLALPDTIPPRVLKLAQEVAGQANSRYDQAHAIELFLRAYTYTLELPPLPRNQDLVDHFLFDLQQGYCDYYASAMVVMARAIGIPARMATGYAQGNFDYEAQRWVVTEEDGHSWVEIYFDRIGWVEFEPTAGLAVWSRPGADLPLLPLPPVPRRPVPWTQLVWLSLAFVVVGSLLAAAVFLIWQPQNRSSRSAVGLVQDRHFRLARWGRRLGRPQQDGQTPYEYGVALAAAARARGANSRWHQVRQAAAEVPAAIEQLTETFIQAQYAPVPLSDREAWQVRDQWPRLRRLMWWLWLLGR